MSFLFEQLPLAVQLRDDATFENFYPENNALIVEQLKQQLQAKEPYVFLFGGKGTGRSHLLQAVCHQADSLALSSVYLPLADLASYKPNELFQGLAALQVVCLDDIQLVAGLANWEEAIFYLYNELRAQGHCLLVSADRPLSELPIAMPDLNSRLAWGASFQLRGGGDDDREMMLKFRAERRGLHLSDEVCQYILRRSHRDISALLDVLDTLDKASLSQRRKITIPFVKETLAW